MPAGEARRFSIALLVGQDYDDLTLNAITAQDIYVKNYQFAKPPEKPNVIAVPGDQKVTLYWDDIEEASEVTPLPKNASSQLLVKYAGASGDFYQI